MVFKFFILPNFLELFFKETVVENDAGIIMVHEWSWLLLRCYLCLQEAIQSNFNPSVTMEFKSNYCVWLRALNFERAQMPSSRQLPREEGSSIWRINCPYSARRRHCIVVVEPFCQQVYLPLNMNVIHIFTLNFKSDSIYVYITMYKCSSSLGLLVKYGGYY
jgi:hypothetical protein